LGIEANDNISPIPSISAIWSTLGAIFLTEKADTSPPPVTSFDANMNFVNKVHKSA
jgi:hypothetical protein